MRRLVSKPAVAPSKQPASHLGSRSKNKPAGNAHKKRASVQQQLASLQRVDSLSGAPLHEQSAAARPAATPQSSPASGSNERGDAAALVNPVAPAADAAPAGGGLGGGRPLPMAERRYFEPRLNASLAAVRLHTSGAAAASVRGVAARAYTVGHDIAFAEGEYAPESQRGLALLAHELTHVAQFVRHGAAGEPRHAELEANNASVALSLGTAVSVRSPVGPGLMRSGNDTEPPAPGWESPSDSLLCLTFGNQVVLLPATGLVYVPTGQALADARTRRPFVAQDLGTLMDAPAVGAAGTRVIRIGARSALLLDAGSDTRGVPAAVYMAELQGALGRLGVTNVLQVRILHVHADHVSRIADVLAANPGATIAIPATYLQGRQHRALRTAIAAVQQNPAFGPTWQPTALRDRGGGDITRLTFSAGDISVEQIGLRSVLRQVTSQPDRASYLTRVTRRTDGASIVVLGDLRMADLEVFRRAMEAQRPGSWTAFFSGVTTLSGFSHHAGRMAANDISGLMALLDATMFRTGRLRVVEQVNLTNAPARERQARAETIELMRRLGIELTYSEMPSGTPGTTSGARASRDTVSAQGPNATVTSPIRSPFTDGLGRLRRLMESRQTMLTWRPLVDAQGEAQRRAAGELIAQVERSIADLTTSLRATARAAATVRTSGTSTSTGRDYGATGGGPGQAYQAALAGIPRTTPGEASLGPEGFRELERLRQRPASEVPLRVALHAALTQGVYSDAAFRYMLAQMDPATRNSILYGRRGGLRPQQVAFQRLRAEFGFRSSVMPSGQFASAAHLPRGQAVAARGAALFMLAVEGARIGLEAYQSVQIAADTRTRRHVVPFLRRYAFWSQLGIQPALVAVRDPTFGSPQYTRDPAAIERGLSAGSWDALFIEHTVSRPAITDADVLRLGMVLSHSVRNLDEYATLFDDSNQDAVRFRSGGGDWSTARWSIRVGHYETSGSNRVEERWEEHARLTELMNMLVRRIIANTSQALRAAPARGLPDERADSPLGGFATTSPPRDARRVRLRGAPRRSTVYVIASGSTGWGGGVIRSLPRTIEWWSPPVFYVHRSSSARTLVSGADYNTFTQLRGLETENYYTVAGGNQLNAPRTAIVPNATGTVEIDSSELEDVR